MEALTRDCLSCKVCIRPLYEPFVLSCGHTFCYSCLTQWFDNNVDGRKRSCPECRSTVEHAPAPNYIVRQLVHKLIQQQSFCEDGESPETHAQAMQEEALIVERDRANTDPVAGGLFSGRFRHQHARGHVGRIRDFEDGVERCPHCTWEIEDDAAACPHCGWFYDDMTSDDEDDDDFDVDHDLRDLDPDHDSMYTLDEVDAEFDLDALEEAAADHGIHVSAFGRSNFSPPTFGSARDVDVFGYSGSATDDSEMPLDEDEEDDDDEEEEEEDDDDESMDGFIEDDVGSGSGSSRSASETSDDEDSDGTQGVVESTPEPPPQSTQQQQQSQGSAQKRRRPVVIDSSDEASSEDEGGPVRNRPRRFQTASRIPKR